MPGPNESAKTLWTISKHLEVIYKQPTAPVTPVLALVSIHKIEFSNESAICEIKNGLALKDEMLGLGAL